MPVNPQEASLIRYFYCKEYASLLKPLKQLLGTTSKTVNWPIVVAQLSNTDAIDLEAGWPDCLQSEHPDEALLENTAKTYIKNILIPNRSLKELFELVQLAMKLAAQNTSAHQGGRFFSITAKDSTAIARNLNITSPKDDLMTLFEQYAKGNQCSITCSVELNDPQASQKLAVALFAAKSLDYDVVLDNSRELAPTQTSYHEIFGNQQLDKDNGAIQYHDNKVATTLKIIKEIRRMVPVELDAFRGEPDKSVESAEKPILQMLNDAEGHFSSLPRQASTCQIM